jgi:hypothetical protein
MLSHILLALLLLSAPALADMEISGHYAGTGYQEHSLEAAGQLIQSVHDSHPNARSWCFLLETHGYSTDGKSLLWINGTEYNIFENGSIMEAM